LTPEIISIGLIAIAGGDSEGKLTKHRTPEPTEENYRSLR